MDLGLRDTTAITFLASGRASGTTGTALPVDGDLGRGLL